MKPGNLINVKVPNPAATKDEDSIEAHVESFDVCRFFCERTKYDGKKTVYL